MREKQISKKTAGVYASAAVQLSEGLHVTPVKSRVLWQTCKVLQKCFDASFPFIVAFHVSRLTK